MPGPKSRTSTVAEKHTAKSPASVKSTRGGSGSGRPLFPKSRLPVFSLLFAKKLSKSLIPHGDCPFVLNRLHVFLENLPVSGTKTGKHRTYSSNTTLLGCAPLSRFFRYHAAGTAMSVLRNLAIDC